MKRLIWAGLGAAVGAIVLRKASRAAQAYTPTGLAKSLAGVGDSLRELADEARVNMAERESELRLALGVDEGPIEPRRAAALLDRPGAALDPADDPADDGDRASNPARRARSRSLHN